MRRVIDGKSEQSALRASVTSRYATAGFVALCASALVFAAPGGHAEPKVARAAVATESALATREAMAELDAGGNAVDAIGDCLAGQPHKFDAAPGKTVTYVVAKARN